MRRTILGLAARFAARLAAARIAGGSVVRSSMDRSGSRNTETSRALRDPRLLAFARGISLGALLGAAVAGSTIWRRVPRRGRLRRRR